MQFPQPTLTWEFLLGFVEIWRLWVPLFLLLIVMAWATRRWWGGKLLLVSLVLLVAFAAKVTLRERAIQRATTDAWNKLRVPLPESAKIAGLQLAAGTIVRWNKEREGHLLTAELGSGQEVIPGVVLTGDIDQRYDEWWRGRLIRDSIVRGWKCAAGKIEIYDSGELRWCLLASPQKMPVGEIPARTAVLLEPGEPSDVLLHLPKVGMRANPGDFWMPPDEWFVLYEDGELSSVPGPITLRGVLFKSGVELRYGDEDVTRWYHGDLVPVVPTLAHPDGPATGWRGDPAYSLRCEGGHTISEGSRITVPVTGNLVTTTHWDSGRPKAKPVLDSYHCELDLAR